MLFDAYTIFEKSIYGQYSLLSNIILTKGLCLKNCNIYEDARLSPYVCLVMNKAWFGMYDRVLIDNCEFLILKPPQPTYDGSSIYIAQPQKFRFKDITTVLEFKSEVKYICNEVSNSIECSR